MVGRFFLNKKDNKRVVVCDYPYFRRYMSFYCFERENTIWIRKSSFMRTYEVIPEEETSNDSILYDCMIRNSIDFSERNITALKAVLKTRKEKRG